MRLTPSRGVLTATSQQIDAGTYAPSAALSDHVAHFWTVHWDLRGEPARVTEVLSHPNIHLVFEGRRADIVGVTRRRFTRRIEGAGRVFGIKLQPGAFFPIAHVPASQLTDRRAPIGATLKVKGLRRLSSQLEGDDARSVEVAERWLLGWLAPLDSVALEVNRLVAQVLKDSRLASVDALASWSGHSPRALQRLFQRYIGVGPKWVIQRYRLHEAAEQLKAGTRSIADLAAALGYFNQAHFVRDFKAMVGLAPTAYVKQRLKA